MRFRTSDGIVLLRKIKGLSASLAAIMFESSSRHVAENLIGTLSTLDGAVSSTSKRE
jgi:hypothetical protein